MPYSSPAGLTLSLGLVIDEQLVAAGATFTIAYSGLLYACNRPNPAQTSTPITFSIQFNYYSTSWDRIAPAKNTGGFAFLGNGSRLRAYNEGAYEMYLVVHQLAPMTTTYLVNTLNAAQTVLLEKGLITSAIPANAGFLYWKASNQPITTTTSIDTALLESSGVNMYFFASQTPTYFGRLVYPF